MMHKGELREQRFHTGTVELNYAEGPASGEALLYLPGGNGRWQEGGRCLRNWPPPFRYMVWSGFGHGLSGRVPGAYRLQDYVPDLATVFDQGRMNQGYDAQVLLPAIRCLVLLLQADPEAGGLTPQE